MDEDEREFRSIYRKVYHAGRWYHVYNNVARAGELRHQSHHVYIYRDPFLFSDHADSHYHRFTWRGEPA